MEILPFGRPGSVAPMAKQDERVIRPNRIESYLSSFAGRLIRAGPDRCARGRVHESHLQAVADRAKIAERNRAAWLKFQSLDFGDKEIGAEIAIHPISTFLDTELNGEQQRIRFGRN